MTPSTATETMYKMNYYKNEKRFSEDIYYYYYKFSLTVIFMNLFLFFPIPINFDPNDCIL